MAIRYCLVPTCKNNSIKTPSKLFIRVPTQPETREKWYIAINPTKRLKSTFVFVCEDHFNLEDDAENWMQYKLIGNLLRMKKNVVPHKNMCENLSDISTSQISFSAKRLKYRNRQILESQKKLQFDAESSSPTTKFDSSPSGMFRIATVKDLTPLTCVKCLRVRVSKRRILKKIAVPTKKLPGTSSTEQPSNQEHRLNFQNPANDFVNSPVDTKMILPVLSDVPNKTRKYKIYVLKNNTDQELNKQFEFVSLNVDGIKEEMLEDNITIKDEFIEWEDSTDQEIKMNIKYNIKEEHDSLSSPGKQQTEEITVKDEFIDFAEIADRENRINTNFNIKVEPDDSLISSEKQQAQETLLHNITIKEEYIGFEDSVDQKIVHPDSLLNFNIKVEADDSSILSEMRHTEEILDGKITIKKESIDIVDQVDFNIKDETDDLLFCRKTKTLRNN